MVSTLMPKYLPLVAIPEILGITILVPGHLIRLAHSACATAHQRCQPTCPNR